VLKQAKKSNECLILILRITFNLLRMEWYEIVFAAGAWLVGLLIYGKFRGNYWKNNQKR